MSALVRRIRRLILSGGSNQELQEAIGELGLTAGEPTRGSLQKLQRIILNSGRDSEVQLRRALNGIGITGGDAGGRERVRIRDALIKTGRVDELREAIDTLITLEAGTPEWLEDLRAPGGELPSVAVGLADNSAWTEAGGEVALTDYIETDPNGYSNYIAGNLVEGVGYREADGTPNNSGFSLKGAALAAALDAIAAGGVVIVVKGVSATGGVGERKLSIFLTDDSGGNVELSAVMGQDSSGDDPDAFSFIADFVNFEQMVTESGFGEHNIAYRYTTTRVAASIDGQAVVGYADPDVTAAITGVHFRSAWNFAIGSVGIYPLADISEAQLPAVAAN